jgi:hypothetical protein
MIANCKRSANDRGGLGPSFEDAHVRQISLERRYASASTVAPSRYLAHQQLRSLAGAATAAPPPYFIALSAMLEIARRIARRPGRYCGPPFTGVGYRAAHVGTILADPFDRGIGEYLRLPPCLRGSSR